MDGVCEDGRKRTKTKNKRKPRRDRRGLVGATTSE
jgi:hypothetical protein